MSAEKEALESPCIPGENLFQRQKMDLIGRLSTGVAHEFNNSLQNIVTSLELVRRMLASGRGPETEKFITAAVSAAKSAAALNQRLGMFARTQPFSPQPVAVNALIDSVLEILRPSVGRTIKFDLDLTPDPWQTYCDANQAEVAIMGLVLSACEAMPEGGIVSIQSRNCRADAGEAAGAPGLLPGEYVCISVRESRGAQALTMPAPAPEVMIDQGCIKARLAVAERFARNNGGRSGIVTEAGSTPSVTTCLPRYEAPA